MSLSQLDRVRLAECLISSLDGVTDHNVGDVWAQEAEARYQQFLRGEAKTKAAEDVFAEVRKKLK